MGYRNDQINEWGSYEDRKNSYDDDADLNIFKEMVQTNGALRSYIKRHTGLCQFTGQAVVFRQNQMDPMAWTWECMTKKRIISPILT